MRLTAAVAVVLVVGFVLLRLVFATPLGGFAVASDDFVDPLRTPDPLPVATATGGYDGQFVYRLAIEPWTDDVSAHGVTLDTPAYRQQRIATPVLAWAVGLLPGVSTLLALLLVNAVALVVAAWYAARLAAALGRHPMWGLVLALPAGMPISLGRHLTEPVAWAAVVAALWYARDRRWAPASAALTVAVLARETSLVVAVGLLVAEGWRLLSGHPGPPAGGERQPDAGGDGTPRAAAVAVLRPTGRDLRPLAWLAVPVAVAIGWQLVLLRTWGTVPALSTGTGNLAGRPLLGVLGTLLADVPGPAATRLAVSCERVAVLALFCYAGWALVTRRSRLTGGETVAWVLAVGLALSLRGWATDVQFLRAASEGLGLSVLVALCDRGRAGRWAGGLAAVMACCVALEYAVRQ